ncbi:tetratricopeptide repeat protein [Methylomonas paludis]|uniref:protein O-GlcNAc transferase n=1 Tax=Methylomonas paludis TaxID=1173101 RepID=A0A975MKM5_9GAMM|nr:glycosyltransferase family 41 protein [Methylomonas paludis]QWF69556.1 tetratricopeptide repeat protein [Methylomonas paludis]
MKPDTPSFKQQQAFLQGRALLNSGQFTDAAHIFQKLLKNFPRDTVILLELASVRLQEGNFEAALQLFERVLQLNPQQAGVWFDRANLLRELGGFQQAIAAYDRVLALEPDNASAYINRGITQDCLTQYPAALASFAKAIALQPDNAAAYYNQGHTLQRSELYSEALHSYACAITLKPDFAEAHYCHGLVLNHLKDYETALLSFNRALALKPDFAAAYNNRGFTLQNLQRYAESLTSLEQAMALNTDNMDAAYINSGVALLHLDQREASLESFTQALVFRPDSVAAYYGMASALYDLKRYEAALACYEQVLALQPDYAFLHGQYWHTRLQICAWQDLDTSLEQLAGRIETAAQVSTPFPVLAFFDDPALQRQAAEIWTTAKYADIAILPGMTQHPLHQKIRVAYFSADFRNHPVAFLTAQLFEHHDRDSFEIIGFAFGPDRQDAMRTRLEEGFDRFIDIRSLSDLQAVQLARSLEIDIAVDLGGYTTGCRSGIFALRAAPVQVSYLGYPGTMGAEFMDYLIADRIVIPAATRRHYVERIVYLPDSFQVNDSDLAIADKTFSRADFGLPAHGFVFCCFNNTYKIQAACFLSWLRILAQVPGSVLWLPEDNAPAMANLQAAAHRQGIGAERVVFAPRLPSRAEHLARLGLADLFLDTLPYNAHTTASDALWAGLPVLTCAGESFAGRVAASLLTAIGLPELITTKPTDYQALAVELAIQPDRLAAIKAKLAANRLTTPLFDCARFTAHLEAAFTQMYVRSQAGLAPVDLDMTTGNA